MGNYKKFLDEYMGSVDESISFSRHIPDSIFKTVLNYDDYLDFVESIPVLLDRNLIEFDCDDSYLLFERMAKKLNDDSVKSYMEQMEIESEYGRIAYCTVLAFGGG